MPERANLTSTWRHHFGGAVHSADRSVTSVVGEAAAEGYGFGYGVPLWMTVHEIEENVSLTAWYQLDEETGEPTGLEPVSWLERPIVPDDGEAQLAATGGLTPAYSDHLVAWPERGLCVRHSPRSGLPTLVLGFAPCSPDEFEQSPVAFHN